MLLLLCTIGCLRRVLPRPSWLLGLGDPTTRASGRSSRSDCILSLSGCVTGDRVESELGWVLRVVERQSASGAHQLVLDRWLMLRTRGGRHAPQH